MSEESISKMRFYATYPFEIDVKRRVQVPSKWRLPERVIGGQRVAVASVDFMLMLTSVRGDKYACITAMPAVVFEQYARRVEGLPLLDPLSERLRQFLGSRSEPVSMDAAGRITLPSWMTDRVGIGTKNGEDSDAGKVMLRGEVDRFSIWCKRKFDVVEAENEKQDDSDLFVRL